jgi:class 3 adenylate cyclase
MAKFKLPDCSVPNAMDLLEHAKANRQRAAHVREDAAEFTRLSDRLQAREGAMVLDRQAAVLEARAAEQIAALSRS